MMARLLRLATPHPAARKDPPKSFRFRRAAVIVAAKAASDSWHVAFRVGRSGLGKGGPL
jgi:hypothetical protein